MSETERKSRAGLQGIQALRQRRGGVPKEVMELSREQAKMRQKICGVLKNGPMTVPEIQAATGIPARTVFWYLMAWKKYGKVVEGEQRDDYYQYTLAAEESK